jgi:hypothetical protein
MKSFAFIIFILSTSILYNANAQIENKYFGRWVYKGKNKSTGKKIHLVYQLSIDSVILKGYLNKSDFVIMKGVITQNLEKNKVKILYSKIVLNGDEGTSEGTTGEEEMTITYIDTLSIIISTISVPSRFDPKPEKDEFIFRRIDSREKLY